MTDILSSAPQSTTATLTNDNDDVYEPRRSTRIKNNSKGDGDKWQEKLVVCEAAGSKLVVRSYFRNNRTGKRVWDEPPTGASQIEPASSARRQEAEEELKNLQVAMDNAPPPQVSKKSKGSSKKGKGFFSAFRKKPKDRDGSSSTTGKGGGIFIKKDKTAQGNGEVTRRANDVDGDEDLQRAISLSMGLQTPGTGIDTQHAATEKFGGWQEDQEALDLAKAISMSEAEFANPEIYSEEEMLQRALDESSRGTKGVASMPSSELGFKEDESESEHLKPPPAFLGKSDHDDDDDFLNQKMPAKPYLKSPPTTNAVPMSFDPYAVAENSNPPPVLAASASADFFAPSAAAAYNNTSGNHLEIQTSNGLRKMEENDDGHRKPAAGLGRLVYNKRNMESEAGVV